jgi:23S rRNA (guanine2445-N2)-methyltransferase / 23S rRNA (guanine2069-N7)-methyltransferase
MPQTTAKTTAQAMSQNSQEFFATAAKGMEEVLVQEVLSLGATEAKPTRAGVSFRGTLKLAYRVCLHSRVASRVLLPLKTFAAPTPEKLYGGVKSVRWSDHLSPRNTLAVDFSSSRSAITHTQFGALKVKDAIVDQFRSVQGTRPSVDTAEPDVRINVYVHDDQATVSIDLSGQSLHRRGYRDESVPAPLKENLAAAMLLLARWPERAEAGAAFLDPMCGSGTLPIEAGLIAARVAPGLFRQRFGFERWGGHQDALWKELRAEAESQVIRDPKKIPKIIGTDRDVRAVRAALSHVERAGLRGMVHIERRDFGETVRPDEQGILMINPPYGERLGEIEELKPLYAEIGHVMKQRFAGWEGYVLTSEPDLAKAVRLSPARKYVLFNGAIECRLLKYELFSGSGRSPKLG